MNTLYSTLKYVERNTKEFKESGNVSNARTSGTSHICAANKLGV